MTKRARLPTRLFIAVLLALSWPRLTETPTPPVDRAVYAALGAQGETSVIVAIDAPFTPEGALSGATEVDAQRRRLAVVTTRAAHAARRLGIAATKPFVSVPAFGAVVDAEKLRRLLKLQGIKAVEANHLLIPAIGSSVPDIGAPAIWSRGWDGNGWTVAVVDSGVQKTHTGLAGRVVSEACFSTAGGLYGTSLCPQGVSSSTAGGSGVNCPSGVEDCDHGTHVAGIVGSQATGMRGVAPGASIIAIQANTRFDDAGTCAGLPVPCAKPTVEDLASALQRVIDLAGPSNAARIAAVNLSQSSGGYSRACDSLATVFHGYVNHLRSLGIATVAASGNGSRPDEIGFPACLSNVVSVGATQGYGAQVTLAPYSNRASFLSLVAPGTGILSLVPDDTPQSKTGTSFAAPHVSGAWALLKQAEPRAGVGAALSALQATGVPVNDLPPNASRSFQRLRLDTAVDLLIAMVAASVPDAPGTPVLNGVSNTYAIRWTSPIPGGLPTGYSMRARQVVLGVPIPPGYTFDVGSQTAVGGSGAPNGTFIIDVRARNANGDGPWSRATQVTFPIQAALPGSPTNLTASGSGSTRTFTWAAPTTGGIPAGYTLIASLSPGGAPVAAIPLASTGFA